MSGQNMRDPITKWLQAYHDGELSGRKRAQVEAHLPHCPACQAELAELETLSVLLNADPLPQLSTSPEQFVAQVGLRLPRLERLPASKSSWSARALNLVPLVVLLIVGFFQSVRFVSNLLLWIEQLGVSQQSVLWLLPSQQNAPTVLQQVSSLALDWVNPFNNTFLGGLVASLIFAGGYLLWLVLWWLNQDQNGKEAQPNGARS